MNLCCRVSVVCKVRKGQNDILLEDVGTPSRALAGVLANPSTAEMNVKDPGGIAPANNQLLAAALFLALRLSRDVFLCMTTIQGGSRVVIRLQALIINPFDARLPHATHVVPYIATRAINMGYAFPGRV